MQFVVNCFVNIISMGYSNYTAKFKLRVTSVAEEQGKRATWQFQVHQSHVQHWMKQEDCLLTLEFLTGLRGRRSRVPNGASARQSKRCCWNMFRRYGTRYMLYLMKCCNLKRGVSQPWKIAVLKNLEVQSSIEMRKEWASPWHWIDTVVPFLCMLVLCQHAVAIKLSSQCPSHKPSSHLLLWPFAWMFYHRLLVHGVAANVQSIFLLLFHHQMLQEILLQLDPCSVLGSERHGMWS